MVPESIQSLILSLNRQGIEAIIGGGLAVNAHGFARLTLDADLLVRRTDQEEACRSLEELGFSAEGTTRVATRFRHKNYVVPFVDLLWTEDETFKVFLEAAAPGPNGLRILSLPHLIAMKIHAATQDQGRGSKDRDDLKYLLQQNAGKVAREDYQKLVERFARPSRKEELLALYPVD